MSGKWTHNDIPKHSIFGRTVLVTGANTGLGFECARQLALKKAAVIMACRDMEKGHAAVERISNEFHEADVWLIHLDLADLSSVREFAREFNQRYLQLDLLINNAGVMALPRRRETADGFEMHFGVNHLGHFALTGLLMPALRESPAARVVTVSSGLHMVGSLNFDNLGWERGYNRWLAYGRSKLANLLFTYELQRKLESSGSPVRAMAAHPGYAATELQRHAGFFATIGNQFAQSAAMGSLPSLYAATSPDAVGGAYYGPRGLFQQWGYPTRVGSSRRSRDEAVAARLWAVSEDLTGVVFKLP